MKYAEGANYAIELSPTGFVECRVWKRPELDSATGARFAQEMSGHLVRLAAGPATAILFDLSDAPPAFGPKTEVSMRDAFRAAEKAGKPVAVILGETGIQRLQLDRVVHAEAPTWGRLATSRIDALAWLRGAKKR